MKVSSTVVILLFPLLSGVVVVSAPHQPRYTRRRKSSRSGKSGAFYWGQSQASGKWSGETCGSRDDFLDWWDDEKGDIEDDCNSRYRLENDNIDDCIDGAYDFATEQTAKCTTVTGDCSDTADKLATDAVEKFCGTRRMKKPKGRCDPIPYSEGCVETVKRGCYGNTVHKIEDLINDNRCGDFTMDDLDSHEYRRIDGYCDDGIAKWKDGRLC